MKILVVCQYYYPENFQVTPICEDLVKRGHSVTVVTGLPNYPIGRVPDEYKNNKKRHEYINGVEVIRCFEIGRRKGAFFLALNYLSFYLSSMFKVRSIKEDYDCVFVYQLSPVLMGLPGCYYAKKHKVPLYLYCCDLWPESMKLYIKNESNPLFKIVRKVSNKVYRACDVISVQSKTFVDYFVNEHKIPAERLVYVPAFSDDSYLNENYELDNGIVDFVFLGNVGIAQNLEAVIEAVERIKDRTFKLHIVGDGSALDSIKKLVNDRKLDDKVEFYGRRPVEEMPYFYRLADACIVSLKADNKTGLTLPSKVQGYMAAGKTILGMIDGAAYDVINESGCGRCVHADDVDGLVKLMLDYIEHREVYSNCGILGREYFLNHFSKKRIMSCIEKVLSDLVDS